MFSNYFLLIHIYIIVAYSNIIVLAYFHIYVHIYYYIALCLYYCISTEARVSP